VYVFTEKGGGGAERQGPDDCRFPSGPVHRKLR